MKRLTILIALACMAGPAKASKGTLKGADLRKAVAGKTVYLKSSGITLPIIYRTNGTMSGRLSALPAALAGGKPQDSGRWWITNNQLCQKWSRWLGGKSYCYRLTKNGQNVVWVRNDGRSGTARISG